MDPLQPFLSAVSNAVRSSNGYQLRELYSLNSQGYLVAQRYKDNMNFIRRHVDDKVADQIWRDTTLSYLASLCELHRGHRIGAFKELKRNAVEPLSAYCKSSQDGWVVQPLIGLARLLRALAEQADDELRAKGTPPNQLTSCGITLQGVFSATAASKGLGSKEKKEGALAIGCIMMKTYFKLNTINNCKNIINTINMLRIFEDSTMASQVTWRYYTGRLAVYDDDFQTADEHLSFAFNNCMTVSPNNKRKVLRYLIPVKMLLGIMPRGVLLTEYPEYQDLKTAIVTGDLSLFTRCMESNQNRFLQAGTFLLIEKLELAVCRQLLKRCALMHAELNPAKATQFPLILFQQALELQGVRKDDMELQCLIANLIFRKYVKGYISYKSRLLVLSKEQPFPPLNQVSLGDPSMIQ